MDSSLRFLLLAFGVMLSFNSVAADLTETNSASRTNVTYKIAPGVIHRFTLPLTPAARQSVLASKNPMVDGASVAIAVPPGFNPEVPNPIFIVCATSDGEGSSINEMRNYINSALRFGYVVIAADGSQGKPGNDSPPWRWAMVSTLLDHMNKTWPGSRRWPVVVGGFSGGGKWSGLLGAILSQKGYNLIGVFMGGVNQDFASEAAKIYYPATRFKEVPIFLSGGSDDKVATPQQHSEVKESLLFNGFNKVRLEMGKKAHELDQVAFATALKWFIEQYSRPPEAAASASSSSSDSNGEVR